MIKITMTFQVNPSRDQKFKNSYFIVRDKSTNLINNVFFIDLDIYVISTTGQASLVLLTIFYFLILANYLILNRRVNVLWNLSEVDKWLNIALSKSSFQNFKISPDSFFISKYNYKENFNFSRLGWYGYFLFAY